MPEITIDSISPGGAAVGRIDGRVVFVPGLLPGERARIRLTRERRRYAHGEVETLLEAAAERIEPICAAFAECGGCEWQYTEAAVQADWRREIVTQQISRIGKLETEVRATLRRWPAFGYRNRAGFQVLDGRLAMHRRGSDQLTTIEHCHLIRPELAELKDALGTLHGLRQLILRCGVHTGDRLIIIEGDTVPPQTLDWPATVVRREGERLETLRGSGSIEEIIAGVRLRISGDAFFQVNSDGAMALVEQVRAALQPQAGDHLVDLYAGGGLFSCTLIEHIHHATAVESAASARLDLLHNTADKPITAIEAPVENWHGSADLLVCDPPRTGLGPAGIETVLGSGARAIAYVSCDPATFARDAAALVAAGYRLDWVQPVDMFPQTTHIELVGRFLR